MKSLLTIIIPVYNAEKYINDCLSSIFNQDVEVKIIVVNDGSVDRTLEILNQIKKEKKNLSIINITNHGQGYARNLALKEVKTPYVMFIDADDYIEEKSLNLVLNRIIKDKSDFLCFDWKYYYEKNNKLEYINEMKFINEDILLKDKCKDLLRVKNYFSVNKIYNKKFLDKFNIKYGEGYIYEDNPFWVNACLNASKVSIVKKPLYIVRVNSNSSTKSNITTNKHCNDFLKSFDECIKIFNSFNEIETSYKLFYIDYAIRKYLLYYKNRTPNNYKKEFRKIFYKKIKNYEFAKLENKSYYTKVIVKYNLFRNIRRFSILNFIFSVRYYINNILRSIRRKK